MTPSEPPTPAAPTAPAVATAPDPAGPPADPAADLAADLLVRPGVPADADAVAAMFSEIRHAAVPAMPPPVHTAEEDRAWLAGELAEGFTGTHEVWVAERDGRPVGFMLLKDDWLHSLYVRVSVTGQGIGTAFVDLAKARRPEKLQLWVFESNTGARRLYERLGFTAVERTDGSGNEERAPDVRMVWRAKPTVGGRCDDRFSRSWRVGRSGARR